MEFAEDAGTSSFAPPMSTMRFTRSRSEEDEVSLRQNEVSLAQRESRADFPVVSLRLLPGPCMTSDVQVTKHLPGRLLLLHHNTAPVLALCEGHSTHFTWLSVMRRIFVDRR